MNTSPKEGVIAVVQNDGRFLMIRRAAGILAGGSWCFVGGSIEPGESQAEALVREFSEEVDGEIVAQRKVWEYQRPDGKLLLHWWLATLSSTDLRANPAEVSEMRWCTFAEIRLLDDVLASNLLFIDEVDSGGVDLGSS